MKLGRLEIKLNEKIEKIEKTEEEKVTTKLTLKKKILLGVGALAVGTLGVIAWGKCNSTDPVQDSDGNEDDEDDDYDDEEDYDDESEETVESTESKESEE